MVFGNDMGGAGGDGRKYYGERVWSVVWIFGVRWYFSWCFSWTRGGFGSFLIVGGIFGDGE